MKHQCYATIIRLWYMFNENVYINIFLYVVRFVSQKNQFSAIMSTYQSKGECILTYLPLLM